MLPDDPRHGTKRGESAHRRDGEPVCPPCQEAKRRAKIIAQLYPPKVAAIGSQRRIQALQALGYGRPEIARRMGYTDCGSISRLMKPSTKTIMKNTAARISAVYERLCMTPSPAVGAGRVRSWARRNGYAPPLAWNNIDDPEERPRGVAWIQGPRRPHDEIDPVIVERLLGREPIREATNAERKEAMRRWLAMGNSERSLCEALGWHEGRYTPPKKPTPPWPALLIAGYWHALADHEEVAA